MATERICAVCKTDCSTSERVKDKKGRYFHKGCFERAKKAALAKRKRAQAGAASPQKPVRAARTARPAVASPAVARANAPRSCPNCNAMLQPGAAMCTTCGFNLQTGELMPMLSAVKFDNTPPKKSKGGARVSLPSGSMGALFKNPLVIAACVAGGFAILFVMGMNNPANISLYLNATRVVLIAVGIWVLIDAFQEGALHGVLCFLCGLYSLYYVYGVSTNRNLKVAYSLYLLLFVGLIGLIGANFRAVIDPSFSPQSPNTPTIWSPKAEASDASSPF